MNILQISEGDLYKLQSYVYDCAHNKDLLNFLKQRNLENTPDYKHYYEKYVTAFINEDMFKQHITQKYFINKGISVQDWYLDFYDKVLRYNSL